MLDRSGPGRWRAAIVDRVKIADVHAGLGFRDGAVVCLDLSGLALQQDALRGLAARGDDDALGDRSGSVAEGDRDFGGGIAGVREIDGDEPIVSLGVRRKDAVNRDVGQAFIGVDPIGEKPGEIAAGTGLLSQRRRLTAVGRGALDQLFKIV